MNPKEHVWIALAVGLLFLLACYGIATALIHFAP